MIGRMKGGEGGARGHRSSLVDADARAMTRGILWPIEQCGRIELGRALSGPKSGLAVRGLQYFSCLANVSLCLTFGYLRGSLGLLLGATHTLADLLLKLTSDFLHDSFDLLLVHRNTPLS